MQFSQKCAMFFNHFLLWFSTVPNFYRFFVGMTNKMLKCQPHNIFRPDPSATFSRRLKVFHFSRILAVNFSAKPLACLKNISAEPFIIYSTKSWFYPRQPQVLVMNIEQFLKLMNTLVGYNLWIIIGSDRWPETKHEIEGKIDRFRSGRDRVNNSNSNSADNF